MFDIAINLTSGNLHANLSLLIFVSRILRVYMGFKQKNIIFTLNMAEFAFSTALSASVVIPFKGWVIGKINTKLLVFFTSPRAVHSHILLRPTHEHEVLRHRSCEQVEFT